jgi:hypothetical protein
MLIMAPVVLSSATISVPVACQRSDPFQFAGISSLRE